MTPRHSPPVQPLGMLEWDSIALGLLASDALLKEAPVETLLLRPVTPGRYVCLFTGSVEAVRAALKRGAEVGREGLVDSLFLASPHATLLDAVGGRKPEGAIDAVGVIETLSLCALLLAADAAAKTSAVELLEVRLAMGLGGKAFCVLSGEVSDVSSAVDAGTARARERGFHLRSVVLPRPDERLAEHLRHPPEPFADIAL